MTAQADPAPGLRFIIDEPAAEDFFQTHSALDEAIRKTITCDERIRTVGLIGRWGIGKSTVVTKLATALNSERDKFVFFVYDAWTHQSDPPRRSFLEELINHVTSTRASAKSDWTSELREVAGQLEYTSSKKTPSFSGVAKILILSLIPLPLLYSMIDSALLGKIFSDNPDVLARVILILAIVGTLIPIIVITVAYLATRPWSDWADKTKDVWTAPPDILSLVITRTAEKSEATTLRRNEPTAIEFQRLFRQVLGSLGNKRLVVVIDNLDRLSSREALSIWSVMVGFFANHSGIGPEPRRPVVVLPIDAHSLAELLHTEESPRKGASEALIEKTFDVVFELPEPVLSDWRDYLAQQSKIPFGDEADREAAYWLAHFFAELVSQDTNKIITPRRINRYLNRVAALRAQQHEKFPINVLALYISRKSNIDANLLQFLATYEPDEDFPVNWQTVIAAVHFGVSSEKAAQVSLGEPLSKSVQDRDIDQFVSLAGIAGFPHVLERFATSPPMTGDSEFDPLIILSAASLADEAVRRGVEISDVAWARFAAALARSSVRDLDADTYAGGISALASHLPQEWLSRVYVGQADQFVRVIAKTPDDKQCRAVVAAYDGIAERAVEADYDGPLFLAGSSVSLALRLLNATTQHPRLALSIRSTASWAEVGSYLVELLQDPDLHSHTESHVRMLNTPQAKAVFAGNSDAAYNQLGVAAAALLQDADADKEQLASAARLLGAPGDGRQIFADIVAKLAEEGEIQDQVSAALTDGSPNLVAALIALSVTFDVKLTEANAAAVITAAVSSDLSKQIITDTRAMNDGSFVRRCLELKDTSNPLFGLIYSLLAQASSDGDIGHKVPVRLVLQNLESLLDGMETIHRRPFVDLLSNFHTFEEGAFSLSATTFVRLVKLLHKDKGARLAGARLDQLTGEQWSQAVQAGDANFDLARHFSSEIARLSDDSRARTALAGLAPTIAQSRDRTLTKRWFLVLRALPTGSQATVVASLAAEIASGGHVGDLLTLLREGGGLLLKSGVMKPDTAIRTVVVPLLEARPGRQWALRNSTDINSKIGKASRDSVASLRVELDRLARSSSKWKREDAAKLREAFGLK